MRLPARHGRIALLLAIAIAGLSAAAPTAQAGASATDRARLQRALRAVVAAGVPGAAAVRRGPRGVELVTAGVRRRGTRRPIGLNDRFRIASVSKAFNAVLIVQLAQQGRLRLNDTVARWLPGLLARGGEITLAQLLQHTSGLRDYTHDQAFRAAFGQDLLRRWTAREVIAFVADDPLNFAPGTRYEYSDTDNLVAGLVVERITGQSYAAALRARILRPLGLRRTFLATGTAIPSPFVTGYQYDRPNGRGTLDDVTRAVSPTAAGASGAIVSSLSDLSRFWQGLLGGRLLRRAWLARMLSPTVAGGGSPLGPGRNRSGLGIFAWTMPCGTLHGHTGSFPGYQTFSGGPRNGRSAIVVMANATQVSRAGGRRQTAAYQEAACQAIRAAR